MANNRAITDKLTLSNSQTIPQLGFGVYKSPADLTIQSCTRALDVGYRHIDTAQFYANESEVGKAVKQYQDLKRQDVYLTTKILESAGSVEANYKKCIESVKRLNPGDENGGYVDLFLIHSSRVQPEQRKDMWLGLERLYEEKRALCIGVSNYGIKHIEEMKEFAKVWPPHVNQIELHPWHQQKEIVQYCKDHGIIVQAYCPIARNRKADDETVAGIAKKHGVTPNQVLIRWSLEKGWTPLPKSDNPERIKTNAELYGFTLDKDDMNALDGLDQGTAGALVLSVPNE